MHGCILMMMIGEPIVKKRRRLNALLATAIANMHRRKRKLGALSMTDHPPLKRACAATAHSVCRSRMMGSVVLNAGAQKDVNLIARTGGTGPMLVVRAYTFLSVRFLLLRYFAGLLKQSVGNFRSNKSFKVLTDCTQYSCYFPFGGHC
jgi:hypothetical protein